MTLTYDYYPAVLYAIDLISQGRTKTDACDKANIKIPLFDSYVNKSEELAEMMIEAETRGYDAMAEALLNIDYHHIHGRSDPKMAKVISDNIKWLLDKRRNKQYGSKVTVEHNLTADKAIINALNAGRNRAAIGVSDETIIDVTPQLTEEEQLAILLGK